jgi:hypothetical protein
MAFILLLFGCSGHISPIPTVQLDKTAVYESSSKELKKAKAFGEILEQNNIEPIYFYIEGSEVLVNATSNSSLPNNFKISTMYAVTVFGKKVVMLTDRNTAMSYLSNKETKNRLFLIEGAITGFNENGNVVESGVDVGLDFGNGKGSTDGDSDFENRDKISSLTVSIFFKQNGRIFDSKKSKIDIHSSNRGYYMGISINGSGLGMNAHHSKKEGVGEALDRVLYYSLHQMLKKVVGRDIQPTTKESKKRDSIVSKVESRGDVKQLYFQPTIPMHRY